MHALRGGNASVDFLAKLGLSSTTCLQVFQEPSTSDYARVLTLRS